MSHSIPASRPVASLHALTGARFVAAFAVLLCHFGPLAGWPAWVSAHGASAVAFFFVLSGFILTYNYVDRLPTGDGRAYRAFLFARFARIYPVLLATLLAMTAALLWVWHRDPSQQPAIRPAALALNWAANLAMLQSVLPRSWPGVTWCGPAWSVSCEAFFYLAFPPVLWQIRRLRRPGTIAAAAAGVWAVTALGVVAVCLVDHKICHRDGSGATAVSYTAPYLRIGDFVVGCLAGLWFVRRGPATAWPGRASRELACWGGVAVTFALGLVYQYHLLPPELVKSAVFVPACAVLVLALASGPTSLGGLLSGRALCHLGEASYSLYLIHALPLMLLTAFVPKASSTQAVLAIGGSVLASLGVFRAVEDPCRKLLRTRPTMPILSTPAFVPVPVVALEVIAAG